MYDRKARAGGETGVKSVQMIEGNAVWEALDQGRISKRLLEAAFYREVIPLVGKQMRMGVLRTCWEMGNYQKL